MCTPGWVGWVGHSLAGRSGPPLHQAEALARQLWAQVRIADTIASHSLRVTLPLDACWHHHLQTPVVALVANWGEHSELGLGEVRSIVGFCCGSRDAWRRAAPAVADSEAIVAAARAAVAA